MKRVPTSEGPKHEGTQVSASGDHSRPAPLRCSAVLHRPRSTTTNIAWRFLNLPKQVSDTLPSRGQVAVEGTINRAPFQAILEPDGQGGHWLKLEAGVCEAAGARAGETVQLQLSPMDTQPEPEIPPDLQRALAAAPARTLEAWSDITPAARRDFVHWITSPKRPETRLKRIATACDMLANGKRRPCCFDRSGMYSKSLRCPVADD
ncbi:MAG: YdeI/OmpD-associated family protein [Planctomycetota bacterium]|nr:YdeI/OmpD-associated family protein [Planctomycetota bacterium]